MDRVGGLTARYRCLHRLGVAGEPGKAGRRAGRKAVRCGGSNQLWVGVEEGFEACGLWDPTSREGSLRWAAETRFAITT